VIKVMVRHIDSTEGKLLGMFPPENLGAAVTAFKTEQTFIEGYEEEQTYVESHFTDVGNEVVYEIILE
jgi:hypothetical protein